VYRNQTVSKPLDRVGEAVSRLSERDMPMLARRTPLGFDTSRFSGLLNLAEKLRGLIRNYDMEGILTILSSMKQE